MRIALDARTIYRPNRRGTGKNLIDLYRHVAAMRPDWQVVAYHREAQADPRLLPSPNIIPKRIEMPGDRYAAWQNLRLPLAAWRDDADLLHCPANAGPHWTPLPAVVTIHDLIPLDLPQGRSLAEVLRFERGVQAACRHAAHIICPSVYTRDLLVRRFDADPRRITVIAWAPDSSVRPVPESEWPAVLDRYGVRPPFVLHFGAGEPRKNTRRLIEAWASLPVKVRAGWQLLVVGLDGPSLARARELAASLDQTRSLRLHGFADESHVPTLLSAAGLLAYPSLSEGFGLPILDAWVTGTPVLTSHATSLPEVAADAAVLVDPGQTDSIARGLQWLMLDGELRNTLITAGRRRLGQYTWQATARRFVRVMEQVAGITDMRLDDRQRAAA